MKVLIDADGCPVVDRAVALCRQYAIPCLLLCATAHEFHRDGAETLVFDKGADSVDYALVNRVLAGDVVITQDYGLASMCLAKSARVLHQDGWEYTSDNIDALLLVRLAEIIPPYKEVTELINETEDKSSQDKRHDKSHQKL